MDKLKPCSFVNMHIFNIRSAKNLQSLKKKKKKKKKKTVTGIDITTYAYKS